MDVPARMAYPSDLTDEQWAILEPLIPASNGAAGTEKRRQFADAEIVSGIVSAKGSSGERLAAMAHSLRPPFAGTRRFLAQQRDLARGTREPTSEILYAIDPVIAGYTETI